jgi:3-oxoadipate CoA-transferase beta subunit
MTGLTTDQIAWRVAQDIPDGAIVNLGIGMPERVAEFIPEGREFLLHSENGLLGMGPMPPKGEEDWNLINAGKKAVTLLPGGCYFHHADSFAMIRGGHIDICVMGAYQVAQNGDLANWSTGQPGAAPAVGGAMDLGASARAVFIFCSHTTKDGSPKLVERCAYPLTALGAVKRIFTELAVIDVTPAGFLLRETAPGISVDEIITRTGAPLSIAPDLAEIAAPALETMP